MQPSDFELTAPDTDEETSAVGERDRILDAAAKAIAIHRRGDPGVHDILREAGVSGRTLYAHFSSKDELYIGLVRRDFDAEIISMSGRLSETNDPLEQIEIWIDMYLDWHVRSGQPSLRAVLTAGPVTRAAGYLEAVKVGRHQFAQLLADCITRANANGQAASPDPMLDAVSIRSMIDAVSEELDASTSMIDRSAVKTHVRRFTRTAVGLANGP